MSTLNASLFSPINQCALTGIEKTCRKRAIVGGYYARILKDNFGNYRALLEAKGVPEAALLHKRGAVIASAAVAPHVADKLQILENFLQSFLDKA